MVNFTLLIKGKSVFSKNINLDLATKYGVFYGL